MCAYFIWCVCSLMKLNVFKLLCRFNFIIMGDFEAISLSFQCLFDMDGSYNLFQYIYMYAAHLDNLKKKNIHVKEVYLISMKKKITKIYFIIFDSKKFAWTIKDFLHRFEIGNVDIFSSFWSHKEYLARLLQCKIPVNSFIFNHVLA